MNIKRVSLRIEETALYKLHVIADHERRSVNSEILVLIRDKIDSFEKENGTISINS